MIYYISCDGELIGTSALEHRDAGMGTASGRFEPTAGYERVRRVFRLFSESQRDVGPPDDTLIAQYYRERDKLSFAVEAEDGQRIPITVVHIADFAEETGDDDMREVEIHVSDTSFFDGTG